MAWLSTEGRIRGAYISQFLAQSRSQVPLLPLAFNRFYFRLCIFGLLGHFISKSRLCGAFSSCHFDAWMRLFNYFLGVICLILALESRIIHYPWS
ncbi:hypothetical protein BCR41DRAFT_59262 [Lobosporangium transversale]|uniref:Uncharacterized protein n=1 Tax=Lobosporangium transversale TaxID=64571 RepID=A0A1Y2GN28_9FUNG|nr:hypothetical protein BCR41DRAFT_59262 [Lobosporangium transversale]ORZ16036.1 hypothetical protein BCR41DRAFT_59262 [Lobosporangium transversale]|eukprot:XP_021881383.1 hypothetical protein BCR41DRAFT_59262 [Lobosporangium transversale]